MTQVRHGAQAYLGELDSALSRIPAERREAVVADVRAHIDDALESGRPLDEVVAELGPAQGLAQEYLGDRDVGPQVRDAGPAGGLLLQRSALVLAAVTAVFVAFLLPHGTAPGGGGLDLGGVLLTLVPAGLAALVLLVPPHARAPVATTVAVLVTALAVLSAPDLGLFQVPVALLLWLAALVPGLLRRGIPRVARLVCRVAGAVLLLVPAALTAALVAGGLEADPALLGMAVLVVGVALWYAAGSRAGYLVTTVLGAGLLVLATVGGGMLVLGLWLFGGLWLALGLGALAVHDDVRHGPPA